MIRRRMVIESGASGDATVYRFRTERRVLGLFWRKGGNSRWFPSVDEALDEIQKLTWAAVRAVTGVKVSRQVRRARGRKWGQRRLA